MADEPAEVECWTRQQVLGSGGFGVVTLWKHKDFGHMIAVKKCRWGTDSLLTPKHKERWTKEVDIMQRLNHRGVVRALKVPTELERELRGELPLLCMEYCSKGDLRQVLNKPQNCCGLSEGEVRALVRDVSSAVDYLHVNKITHRDLKPENIVLQDDADGKVLYKLIDLGYAKELDQSSMCASFVGTLQYLAPELFMSKKYSCTVDYWSLGLVSHEIITGVRPFLPNMTPVSWMSHVQKKAVDDICAYQNEDGSIVFSKSLFSQNHISSCLQYHMERWLRLLLDWDPKRRGRLSSESPDLLVFNMLKNILDKKVVEVFCVPTAQKLSYEVETSTELATLQQWIARDTGLSVAEQELLFPRGTAPDPTKGASQCCPPNDAVEWSLYVLRCGSLALPQVKPQLPQLVSSMIADAKTPVEYVHQKRAWAHAVFFIQQEANLYCDFLRAHRAKMLHVLSKSCELGKLIKTMTEEKQRTHSQHDLFAISLASDTSKANDICKSECSVLEPNWAKQGEQVAQKLAHLEKTITILECKVESIGSQALQLQRSPYARIRIHSNLDSLAEAGEQCYETLRRRSKEQRQAPHNHSDMARVVYNCLKHRDKLLLDEPFNEHLKQLVACQEATNQVINPIKDALQELENIKADIKKMQLQRQADIWNLLSTYLAKQKIVNTTQQVCGLPPLPPSRGAIPKQTTPISPHVPAPTTSAKPITPPSVPTFSSLPESNKPTPAATASPLLSLQPGADISAVINENQALRYATQDLMNRSFQLYRSIVSQDASQQLELHSPEDTVAK